MTNLETTLNSAKKSSLHRIIDHGIGIGMIGGIGTYHILPNLHDYVSQGQELSLEKAAAQTILTAFTIAVYYLTIHYFHSPYAQPQK